MYCENCSLYFDGDICPACGGRKVRVPRAEDLCFLTERAAFWSGLLAEVLKDNGIPFLQKGRLGAALAMEAGPMGEHYRFYVAYENLPAASELVEALFSTAENEENKSDE